MKKLEISVDLEDNPQINNFLKECGESKANEVIEVALKEFFHKRTINRESKIDMWIRVLNELVEWANKNEIEGSD